MPDFRHPVDKVASAMRREQDKKAEVLRAKKVLDYVRAHPGSTTREVFDVVGFGVSVAQKYLRGRKDGNTWRWFIASMDEVNKREQVRDRERDETKRVMDDLHDSYREAQDERND